MATAALCLSRCANEITRTLIVTRDSSLITEQDEKCLSVSAVTSHSFLPGGGQSTDISTEYSQLLMRAPYEIKNYYKSCFELIGGFTADFFFPF